MEKIKAAATRLEPDEQYELFRWWIDSDSFKQRQLPALKRDIALGVEDLEQGRYQIFSITDVLQLAEDISRPGRERLGKARNEPEA